LASLTEKIALTTGATRGQRCRCAWRTRRATYTYGDLILSHVKASQAGVDYTSTAAAATPPDAALTSVATSASTDKKNPRVLDSGWSGPVSTRASLKLHNARAA
jgi:hypothetical protein